MALQTLNRHKTITEPTARGTEHWLFAGHYDPGFLRAMDTELAELSYLQPNWDSYGAPSINPAIIAAARTFIRSLPENLAYRPRVVPMSTGNLQFEWHDGQKVLELEFETPQTIRFLQWHPQAGVEEEDTFGVDDTATAVDLIQWFMSGTRV